MVDFPVCPSSERTMSVLIPFRRGFMKPGRFYCKVVSANLFTDSSSHAIDFTAKIAPSNLFAEMPPEWKSCTAQSLSRFATAPFTQGSLWVYGIRPHSIQRNHQIPIYHSSFRQAITAPPPGGNPGRRQFLCVKCVQIGQHIRFGAPEHPGGLHLQGDAGGGVAQGLRYRGAI